MEILKTNAHPSILGCASATMKIINQDFCTIKLDSEQKQNIIIVADGIGSFYKAEVASEFICQSIERQLLSRKKGESPNFLWIFDEAQVDLKNYIKDRNLWDGTKQINPKQAFGTTVIACVESENTIDFGYLGNGGIYHFRGNFNHFPSSSPQNSLPWCAINLLNPHSIWEKGKNAMYKYIAYEVEDYTIVPSCISIVKDKEYFGDIIVVCTDGIFSYDQVDVGSASDGKVWVSAEETIILLNAYLKKFFDQEEWTNEMLNKHLSMYLEDIRTKNLMSDDCTIGVLITPQVLSFQKDMKNKKANENNI